MQSGLQTDIFRDSPERARTWPGHEVHFSLVGSLHRQKNGLAFRSGNGLYYELIAPPAIRSSLVLPDDKATSRVRLEAHLAGSFSLVVHSIEAHGDTDLPQDQIVLERLLVIAAVRAQYERAAAQAASAP